MFDVSLATVKDKQNKLNYPEIETEVIKSENNEENKEKHSIKDPEIWQTATQPDPGLLSDRHNPLFWSTANADVLFNREAKPESEEEEVLSDHKHTVYDDDNSELDGGGVVYADEL